MGPIRVMLADDQTIIRDGLRALLEMQPDIQVVGEAADGEAACTLAGELAPDVILMDIRMPKMDGVEATQCIKNLYPGIVIIVLTTFDDDDYIIKAMTFGASGYLLKDIGSEKLITSIHDGLSGNIILPGRIAAKITSNLVATPTSKVTSEDFTEREIQIIQLLMQGKTNKEIAQTLFLSIGTVKNYISQIYLKIEVNDRANAVLIFQRLGF